jgi:hypothetical protein
MVASSPRPPSASLIVRSLSKPQGTAHDSLNANLASSHAEVQICRRFCILGAADVLLAMQKVEGSNPFSRFFSGRSRSPTSRLVRCVSTRLLGCGAVVDDAGADLALRCVLFG